MSDEERIDKSTPDVRDIVRQAIEEFIKVEHQKAEPAYKAELHEERKRRESLEGRLNELVEENRKARAVAEEADRFSQIRNELQRMGVAKLDLAFRAIKDDVVRGEDGRLQGKAEGQPLEDYVASFVQQNPELLPARIAGGSGLKANGRTHSQSESMPLELDKIKPGMKKEDLDRVREEIARLASQALRGN
jgi:hypothetical protein